MASTAQNIITAIVARMQTILVSNGFQTNLGLKVADSRPNWDEDELTVGAISVFQGRTASAEWPDARRKTMHSMPVLIKVFLKRGTDASNARIAIADVKKAIRGTGGDHSNMYLPERWPSVASPTVGQAMLTRETGDAIEVADGTYEITGAQVEIEVQFLTGKFEST